MWSPGCICCSPDTVQQESTKKVLQSTPCRQGGIKYVTCIKCSSKVCVHCLDSLTQTMLSSSKCKAVHPSDPSLIALADMMSAAKSNRENCAIGFCCSFSSSIPKESKCTLVKPPRAPLLQSSAAQASEDDEYEFINHDTANKRSRYSMRREHIEDYASVNFLNKYFETLHPPPSMTPPNIHAILQSMNKSRRRSKKSLLKLNQVQGALIYPEFNLLLQSDATNIHWSCDHLAVAESQVDSTPAIIHTVINSVNATDIEDYMEVHSCATRRFNKKSERIVLRVQSPEDETKEMDISVDVFIVDQVMKIDIKNPLKGQSYFDPSFVAGFDFFGQQDIE